MPGRAFPAADLSDYLVGGVGWVPANLALTPLGHIVQPNAFGSVGDLRLIPDPTTQCHVPASDGSTPITALLADLTNTDGTPWECCPRTFLRTALADLEREAGLRVLASFEHEFVLRDAGQAAEHPFSLQNLRRGEPLGSELMGTLAAAGHEPEMWLPEYGPRQFEVTLQPTDALAPTARSCCGRLCEMWPTASAGGRASARSSSPTAPATVSTCT